MTSTATANPPQIKCLDDLMRHLAACQQQADQYTGRGVWIHRCTSAEIDAQVNRLAGMLTERRPLPLLGLTMAVKDNIDVAGLPTTAACPAFAYTPQVSAPVVQALCDAGAIVMGKTNLDQFATGLVGTRSPHGACENFYNRAYISGGSSSGSAVAVAAGMADFALGTDTAGSGRVPAGFNNLYGLKPSLGLLSTTGVVPACRSLDCVSVFTRDLRTSARVMQIAEVFDEVDIYSRHRADITTTRVLEKDGFRFGVPYADDLQFFGDSASQSAFESAIARLQKAGGHSESIDYGPFHETAQLLYEGPWVAERLAAIQEFYERNADQFLPVTRAIIGGAENLSAVDAFHGIYQLAALKKEARKQWRHMDVLAVPTAGTIYTIEQVNADPVQLNKNLGYYTNFVNLLDLCALAVPAGFLPSGLPFGITLIAPAGNEATLFDIAERFEKAGS
ncbi:MAG TPA: allophanate hydrolase [Tepidisphaeraceae bacterium]|jgi:allophanate hydrolase